jgi:hypothetical protein
VLPVQLDAALAGKPGHHNQVLQLCAELVRRHAVQGLLVEQQGAALADTPAHIEGQMDVKERQTG